ncbi:class I SAM-dependent methyltransferase [Paenibacillus hexagrammi]|uniref:Class I SAM-dependent methyltransferase n=1 Tax=Paenibacillus hexagrammi TaxID=2908839 RepID=A0ABY3SHM0_9BACL|nr:class I SAM-dependent methyltransferase [Paenibacillus sp. YPD9-1]UJF33214.1 class I SAM-dependent methyltransferase [Paenibacillus sp. YPD9-1]
MLENEISYYVDNNKDKWHSLFNQKEIKPPSALLAENRDEIAIVVASSFLKEIAAQLKEMGFIYNQHFFNSGDIMMEIQQRHIQKMILKALAIEDISGITALEAKHTEIYGRYSEVQNITQGMLSTYDALAIVYLILYHMHKYSLEQVRALELGSWTGLSSFLISKSINAFSETNSLFCVDSWGEYTAYAPYNAYSHYVDVLHVFRSLMKGLRVNQYIKVLFMPTDDAFALLKNDLMDMAFIDADHTYEYVKRDIINAVQVLKPGSILFGHDFHHYDRELPPRELLQNHIHERMLSYEGHDYFPGVLQAVYEIFGVTAHNVPFSSIWFKEITVEDKKRIALMVNDKKG